MSASRNHSTERIFIEVRIAAAKPRKNEAHGVSRGFKAQTKKPRRGDGHDATPNDALHGYGGLLNCATRPYPRTLTLANDNTARPGVGRPIDVAGRKVVKINMFFTAGNISCASFESDKIR